MLIYCQFMFGSFHFYTRVSVVHVLERSYCFPFWYVGNSVLLLLRFMLIVLSSLQSRGDVVILLRTIVLLSIPLIRTSPSPPIHWLSLSQSGCSRLQTPLFASYNTRHSMSTVVLPYACRLSCLLHSSYTTMQIFRKILNQNFLENFLENFLKSENFEEASNIIRFLHTVR